MCTSIFLLVVRQETLPAWVMKYEGATPRRLQHEAFEKSGILLLAGKDHLLTFALSSLQVCLSGVLPHVFLAPLDSAKLLTLDLTSLLNRLGEMALAFDAANFGHMSVSLDQCLVVLQLRSLTSALNSTTIGGVGTPQANVAIVRSG